MVRLHDDVNMTPFTATCVEIEGGYRSESAKNAADQIRETLDRPARMAFAFASSDYVPYLENLCEIVRVDGHVVDMVGCTAGGRIQGAKEIEEGAGCSILAIDCDAGDPLVLGPENYSVPQAEWAHKELPNAWLALTNPFAFPTDEWLHEWNTEFPGVPCIGGLASGGNEKDVAVFCNGKIVDGLAVPLTGRTTIVPVVSQGCRPIGEPLTVTRAEYNVVYALGGRPAYQALESAFQSLSDSEKSTARGNLFAGLAGNEYIDDFKPGDFLIRNIIGADPDSGAVVIGGIPRIGQTLQYQLRDRSVAEADLDRALVAAPLQGVKTFASLLFSCTGRGAKFFGGPNHDAARLSAAIRGNPLAGFFCNGEIGPVAGKNALHAYTASAAIWVEKSPKKR